MNNLKRLVASSIAVVTSILAASAYAENTAQISQPQWETFYGFKNISNYCMDVTGTVVDISGREFPISTVGAPGDSRIPLSPNATIGSATSMPEQEITELYLTKVSLYKNDEQSCTSYIENRGELIAEYEITDKNNDCHTLASGVSGGIVGTHYIHSFVNVVFKLTKSDYEYGPVTTSFACTKSYETARSNNPKG